MSPIGGKSGSAFDSPLHNVRLRAGFTLLELLLALTVLTVLISLTVPSATALLRRQQFQQVIGDIEQFLLETRRLAVSGGEPYWIRYSSGDRYLVSGRLGEPVDRILKLPEKFEFSRSDLSERMATDLLGELDLEAMNLLWSEEVLFQPDGTTDDLLFEVSNPEQRQVEFRLRGLTGHVALRRLEEEPRGGRRP